MSGSTMMRFLVPTGGEVPRESVELTFPGSLSGLRFGVMNNRWSSMDALTGRLVEALERDHGIAGIQTWGNTSSSMETPRELVDELIAFSDVALVGLAN